MFPSYAALHPEIVHFVIALLIVGVAFRVVSLGRWFRFTDGAAATLLLAGTAAAVLAVSTGQRAHGAAERIPGARQAVQEHEEWGERTRDAFLVVSALEILALLAAAAGPDRRRRLVTGLKAASAVVGVAGIAVLFEAGEHGGDLVYGYAGGVGTRSGDTADIRHLLVAGLYNEAMVARRAGDHTRAAALLAQLAALRPADPATRLLEIESMIQDRDQPRAALAALDSIAAAPAADRFTRFRAGRLRAAAYEKLGMPDSARAVTEALQRELQAARR